MCDCQTKAKNAEFKIEDYGRYASYRFHVSRKTGFGRWKEVFRSDYSESCIAYIRRNTIGPETTYYSADGVEL